MMQAKCATSPYPDHDHLPEFHYRPMEEMPRDVREVDDYQPWARMKIRVKEATLSSSDAAGIKQFSKKFISEQLVRGYLLHLETLQLQHTKRKHVKEQTVSKGNKSYGDYDWVDLYRSATLGKLYNNELDK